MESLSNSNKQSDGTDSSQTSSSSENNTSSRCDSTDSSDALGKNVYITDDEDEELYACTVVWSPLDVPWLILGGKLGIIYIMDIISPHKVRKFKAHSGPICDIQSALTKFSCFVSCCGNGEVKLYNAFSQHCVALLNVTYKDNSFKPSSISVNEDDYRIAIAGGNHNLYIFTLVDKTLSDIIDNSYESDITGEPYSMNPICVASLSKPIYQVMWYNLCLILRTSFNTIGYYYLRMYEDTPSLCYAYTLDFYDKSEYPNDYISTPIYFNSKKEIIYAGTNTGNICAWSPSHSDGSMRYIIKYPQETLPNTLIPYSCRPIINILFNEEYNIVSCLQDNGTLWKWRQEKPANSSEPI
ncbi:hypothetical protein WA158_000085 [Blastocystis sp. Blastoise]